MEQRNDMDDIYKTIEVYNLNNKCEIIIVINDMIADMLCLFMRDVKLNVSHFYYTIIFAVQKNLRLISKQYFIMKIPNKRIFQQTTFSHSPDIDGRDFMNLYKNVMESNIRFY